jgi:hypothetical protein
VSVNPPRDSKDYNDKLLQIVKLEQEQKQLCSHMADISL